MSSAIPSAQARMLAACQELDKCRARLTMVASGLSHIDDPVFDEALETKNVTQMQRCIRALACLEQCNDASNGKAPESMKDVMQAVCDAVRTMTSSRM